ncbi:hypothetical protein BpJC7_15310 [Weizmannia acidilactici]|uniref:Uncharacterized protein n=1 Tax=Weizmannia acidilactici TaxID=2607726 RepID=A0A5J4JIE9_9BACI|nr:hypothetical protein [Weizmannia acidilactici]GER66551.1 hypothetical protein BpJC4_10220 [Weizmannia acidilactici]GER70228.1 hypothetical protein BpJC7_15310 [Weizmannia acidilactici]GER74571.1 hypothetical protein BpPP18_26380 [Weizmannia acidilactici]
MEGIAKVHVDAWKTTYKGIVPDACLDTLTYEEKITLWNQVLADSHQTVFMTENQKGKMISFTGGGKTKANKQESSGYLIAIYILKESRR